MSEKARLRTDAVNNSYSNSADDQPIQQELSPEEISKKRQQLFTKILYIILGLAIAAILLTVVIVLVLTYEEKQVKRSLVFNDIFNGTFATQGLSATWSANPSKEGIFYYWKNRKTQARENVVRNVFENMISVTSLKERADQSGCDIIKYDTATNSEKAFISFETLSKANIPCNTNFLIQGEERFVSFELDIEHVWRHSSLSRFVVLDTVTSTITDLSPNAPKQSIMKWCSSSGNSAVGSDAVAAFIQDNNIYVNIFDSTTGKSKSFRQITSDGSFELIFNGIADWVYEEEVIAGVDTFFFSPDCSKISYLRLNDSQVPLIQLPLYDMTHSNPEYLKIRIPTPGDHNPIPSIHVYDINTDKTVKVDIGQDENPTKIEDEYYVYDLLWASNSQVAVVRVNRYQNQKDILLGDLSKVVDGIVPSSIIHTVTTDRWIQYAQGSSFFILDSTMFVDIIPYHDHYHVALFDYSKGTNNTFVRYLTSGDFDVTTVYRKFSSNIKKIYYQSTGDSNGINRKIYAVDLEATQTIELTKNSTAENVHFDASISAGGNYVILTYNGPDFPTSTLHSVQGLISGGDSGVTLSENSQLQKKLENEVFMPKSKVTQVQNDNGDKLNVLFVYPPHWNPQNEVKYPAVIYSYNGPGSQLVNNDWHSMHNGFSLYLASLGFIVVTVDGRGTGYRGVNFMTQTYKNLGYYEVLDQISVAKYLTGLSYVDSSKIAIWGWSYGGYLSSKTISFYENATNSESSPFKLALSVAPVTDWKYYDTAYTERYMLWPEVNPTGYKRSSVLNQVKNPKCPILPTALSNGDVQQSSKKFVLAFGSRDDNVHPINSFNLMSILQDSLVQFDLMVYTNKDHSIDNRRHIYKFLSQHLVDILDVSA
ncbi:dipeptidyl aminopeptidase [Naegleria gruberi]|uniref:Dipeptidyl aminopeptidase n=1 Tax=Naegleria gruberi TaxID=5762 RepID=D2VL41_NAEGR|nr:dipeptidyl aminopeptidase [Naegleria gruberi]EFC42473.1 dipeptidyl aminopeptidase [Naegleria gruberi]|eukprot:XP_002675217.1 dipeptidyl aminopeptidase [Naegleria gruberi strain NEG-M]